jgi:hypothetical protein
MVKKDGKYSIPKGSFSFLPETLQKANGADIQMDTLWLVDFKLKK